MDPEKKFIVVKRTKDIVSLDEFNAWLNEIDGLEIETTKSPNKNCVDLHVRRVFDPLDNISKQLAQISIFNSAADEICLHFAIHGGSRLYIRSPPEIDTIQCNTPVRYALDSSDRDFYTDLPVDHAHIYSVMIFYMRFYADRWIDQVNEGSAPDWSLLRKVSQ